MLVGAAEPEEACFLPTAPLFSGKEEAEQQRMRLGRKCGGNKGEEGRRHMPASPWEPGREEELPLCWGHFPQCVMVSPSHQARRRKWTAEFREIWEFA